MIHRFRARRLSSAVTFPHPNHQRVVVIGSGHHHCWLICQKPNSIHRSGRRQNLFKFAHMHTSVVRAGTGTGGCQKIALHWSARNLLFKSVTDQALPYISKKPSKLFSLENRLYVFCWPLLALTLTKNHVSSIMLMKQKRMLSECVMIYVGWPLSSFFRSCHNRSSTHTY